MGELGLQTKAFQGWFSPNVILQLTNIFWSITLKYNKQEHYLDVKKSDNYSKKSRF